MDGWLLLDRGHLARGEVQDESDGGDDDDCRDLPFFLVHDRGDGGAHPYFCDRGDGDDDGYDCGDDGGDDGENDAFEKVPPQYP